MRTFEIGKTYTHNYIGDHSAMVAWEVLKRTAQTITITDGKATRTCKIIRELTERNNAETVFPEGHFAKCPVLTA